MSEPRRGLEGTGISIWGDHHTEHLARRAAEFGHAQIETLCDAVLVGQAEADELIDLVEIDEEYWDWMRRGYHLGWQTRP